MAGFGLGRHTHLHCVDLNLMHTHIHTHGHAHTGILLIPVHFLRLSVSNRWTSVFSSLSARLSVCGFLFLPLYLSPFVSHMRPHTRKQTPRPELSHRHNDLGRNCRFDCRQRRRVTKGFPFMLYHLGEKVSVTSTCIYLVPIYKQYGYSVA